jgi:hypothetical protein
MIAELHNKTAEWVRKSEDELTGNIFGNFRYFPFDTGLREVLAKAVDDDKRIQEIMKGESVDDWPKSPESIEFWPRKEPDKQTEPDVVLKCKGTLLIIEAKLNSGLSLNKDEVKVRHGEEEHTEEGAKDVSTQLIREAALLEAWERDEYHGYNKILIILGRESATIDIYDKEKAGFKDRGVVFGYLSWQEIHRQINRLLETDYRDDPNQRAILEDMRDLLKSKGLTRFDHFEIEHEIMEIESLPLNAYFKTNRPSTSQEDTEMSDKADVKIDHVGKNIFNAFDVVYETYGHAFQLMEDIVKFKEETGNDEYAYITNRFLKNPSDDYKWDSLFVQAFKKKNDSQSLYVLMIDLWPKEGEYHGEKYKEPMISIMKYVYPDADVMIQDNSFTNGLKEGAYWLFVNPTLIDEKIEKFIKYAEDGTDNKKSYTFTVTKDGEEYAAKNWFGVRAIRGIDCPLVQITGKNMYERIFSAFDELSGSSIT